MLHAMCYMCMMYTISRGMVFNVCLWGGGGGGGGELQKYFNPMSNSYSSLWQILMQYINTCTWIQSELDFLFLF